MNDSSLIWTHLVLQGVNCHRRSRYIFNTHILALSKKLLLFLFLYTLPTAAKFLAMWTIHNTTTTWKGDRASCYKWSTWIYLLLKLTDGNENRFIGTKSDFLLLLVEWGFKRKCIQTYIVVVVSSLTEQTHQVAVDLLELLHGVIWIWGAAKAKILLNNSTNTIT